jgi:hypothetical protein
LGGFFAFGRGGSSAGRIDGLDAVQQHGVMVPQTGRCRSNQRMIAPFHPTAGDADGAYAGSPLRAEELGPPTSSLSMGGLFLDLDAHGCGP